MAQTKKDYEAAAKIVKELWAEMREAQNDKRHPAKKEALIRYEVAAKSTEDAFVNFFQQAGGAFNVDRFRDACRAV